MKKLLLVGILCATLSGCAFWHSMTKPLSNAQEKEIQQSSLSPSTKAVILKTEDNTTKVLETAETALSWLQILGSVFGVGVAAVVGKKGTQIIKPILAARKKIKEENSA